MGWGGDYSEDIDGVGVIWGRPDINSMGDEGSREILQRESLGCGGLDI